MYGIRTMWEINSKEGITADFEWWLHGMDVNEKNKYKALA